MIVVSLLLVLGSAGLLVAGLVDWLAGGNADISRMLVSASLLLGVLAALAVVAAVIRRRSALPVAEVAEVAEPEQSRTRPSGQPPVAIPATPAASQPPAALTDPGTPPALGGGPGAVAPTSPPPETAAPEQLAGLDPAASVMVVDGFPRFHRIGCEWLAGRHPVAVRLGDASSAGFSPCGWCRPVAALWHGADR